MALSRQSPRHLDVALRDGSATRLSVFPADAPASPVVLCLPAMGVTASYYEILAAALADSGFHAVLLDQRGKGGSTVRASRRVSFGYAEILEMELPAVVETVCQEFGVDHIVVLGHSLGGQLGLLFAATSARVSHAVVIAGGSSWYRRVPGIRSVGRFLGLQLLFGTTLVFGHLPTWLPFAGREARGMMRDWGHEALTGRFRIAGSSLDYERALSKSAVPALFVSFPADRFVPAACTDHLARKLAMAKVTRLDMPPERFRLEKTDHFRWARRPQVIVDAVATWLRAPAAHASPF